MSWSGGKGSGRRPADIDDETIADNWQRTFGPSHCDSPDKQSKHNEPESESTAKVAGSPERQ